MHLELHTGDLARRPRVLRGAVRLAARADRRCAARSYLALELGGGLGGGIVECAAPTGRSGCRTSRSPTSTRPPSAARALGATVLLEPREGPAGLAQRRGDARRPASSRSGSRSVPELGASFGVGARVTRPRRRRPQGVVPHVAQAGAGRRVRADARRSEHGVGRSRAEGLAQGVLRPSRHRASAPTVPPSPVFSSGGRGRAVGARGDDPDGQPPHRHRLLHAGRRDVRVRRHARRSGPNGGGQTIVQLTENGEVRVAPAVRRGPPVRRVPEQPGARARPPARRRGDAQGQRASSTRSTRRAGAARTRSCSSTRPTRTGRCHDPATFGARRRSARRAASRSSTSPTSTKPEGDRRSRATSASRTRSTSTRSARTSPTRSPPTASASTPTARARTRSDGARARFSLDGFEVVDLSSCMNFPAGTHAHEKRARCRPQVYRYRYPSAEIALGHTSRARIYGCHELEVYPDDRLTCASGSALIVFDMTGAFDNHGTPNDYTDDKPRGTPLPCTLRGELVERAVPDRRDGHRLRRRRPARAPSDLDVPNWLADGAPSLEGVRTSAASFHQGRDARAQTTYPSTEDIDFDHEAELTASRPLPARHRRARRRRHAARRDAARRAADNTEGNGGVHATDVSKLQTHDAGATGRRAPGQPYARTPGRRRRRSTARRSAPGRRPRSARRTCSSRSRARTGSSWAGTRRARRSIDFTENPDGTVDFKEAGWFIPPNANTWVVGDLQVPGEPRRHVHVLGRDRRLQPRRGGPQRDRRLQGHAAGTAEAAREVARAAGASR